MTPFAQLDAGASLVKTASRGNALRGLHNLVRGGVWKRIAEKTAPKGVLGRTARLFHNPTTGKSTTLNHALTAYGLGGMGASLAGYDLPGSNLALNVATPVMGAMFTAPGIISSMRAGTQANKAKMADDMMTGARGAGSDTLSLGQMDSKFITQPGLMQQYLQKNDPNTAKLVNQYSSGQQKPMSWRKKMQSMFEDPQALINHGIDSRIHGMLAGGMDKSSAMKAIGAGFSHAFPWLFPAMGVGMIGHSLLKDKPYDEEAVRARGYAGAQTKIQQELGHLSGMERFALQMDPTLLAGRLEKKLPGTIQHWEQANGQKYQPGLLSGIANNWQKGGDTNYYSYDAQGSRKYL